MNRILIVEDEPRLASFLEIGYLRRKLGSGAIEAVRGMGYRLAA